MKNLLMLLLLNVIFLSCKNPTDSNFSDFIPNKVPRIVSLKPDSAAVGDNFRVIAVNVGDSISQLRILTTTNQMLEITALSLQDSTTTLYVKYDKPYIGRLKLVFKSDTLITTNQINIIDAHVPKPIAKITKVSIDSIEVFDRFVVECVNLNNVASNINVSLSDGTIIVIDSIKYFDSLTTFVLHSDKTGKGMLLVSTKDTLLTSEKEVTIFPLIIRAPKFISVSSDSLRPKRKFQVVLANVGFDTNKIKLSFTDGVKIYIDSLSSTYKTNKATKTQSIDSIVTITCHFFELSKGKLVLEFNSISVIYSTDIVTTILPWDVKNFSFKFDNIPCSQTTTEATWSRGQWPSVTTHDTVVNNFDLFMYDSFYYDTEYFNTILLNRNQGMDINFTDYPIPIDYTQRYLYMTINPDIKSIQKINFRNVGEYTTQTKNSWTFKVNENISYKVSNDTLIAIVSGNQLQRIIHGFNYVYSYENSRYSRVISKDNYLPLKPDSKLTIKIW